MHRRLSGSYSLALLLLTATTISSVVSFSHGRSIWDDIDEDVDNSINSPEVQQDPPKSSQQSGILDKFVKMKSSLPSQVSVPRGHRVKLSCEVSGNPPPRIYWIRGENPEEQIEELKRESVAETAYTSIANEVSNLVIDCVTPKDQGLIHCVGVSGGEISRFQSTVLSIEDISNGRAGSSRSNDCVSKPSAPIITRHRPLYFSEMGSTVELPCEANGNPRPHVHWVKDDGTTINDPRISVMDNGSLLITSIRWADMNNYKCIAKSTIGHAEASTFLYPAAKSEKANAP